MLPRMSVDERTPSRASQDDWFGEPDGAAEVSEASDAPARGPKAPPCPAPDEQVTFSPEDLPPIVRHVGSHTFTIPRVVVVHSPAEPPRTGPGFRIPVKTLVFMGAAAVGFYLIWPQLLGFWDAVPGLRTIEWWWFALMLALEAASYACYWGMMQVTLRERRRFVVAMTQLSANAFARVVPGGAASGGSISYQMLAAAGVPKGRVVTGLTTNTLLSNAVLFMLPLFSLPAILGGAPIDPSLMRTLVLGVVLFVLIIVGGAIVLFSDGLLAWVGRVTARVLDRVRKSGAPRTALPARLLEERDFIKESLGDRWWQALPCAAGNWLLDFGALLAALAAVGAQPRPSLVLLGYVVAMILTWIPLTPGGLGFVEVGLAATLGLAGVGAAEATTAVLAYRLVSFWLPIPAGAIAGAVFRKKFGGRAVAEAEA
jgi:uncharacterized protein (TIRG00374 family)